VTGKIAGQAVDDRTNLPIANVKVEIVGAPFDALTDEDGDYYILEVPAGKFTLLFTAPGYLNVTKEHARVLLDLTTPVNVRMFLRETEFSEPIIVLADRPLVQKDLTATRYIVTAEQMAFLPNAINVNDVLLNISGTVSDQDGHIHVRGGRAGAVTYIYDGVQVTDPFHRTLGLRIVPHFLEEINLMSGGFPAEYGEAGSGVVNAVTREGNDRYTGSIKLYDGSTHKYNRFSGEIGPLERSDNQALSVNFSGPLDPIGLKNTTFFVAAEGLRDGGYLPHSFTESRTLTGKLSTRPRSNLKLTATGTYFNSEGEDYDHRDLNGISYDLNLDGLGLRRRDALSLGLRANYAYDRETFFQLGINRFETKTKIAPTHLFDVYWDQWPGFEADPITGAYDPANGTLHQDNYEYAPEYGFTGYTYGDDFLPLYSLRSTKYNSANLSVTHQIDKRNQTKVGAELRKYHIFLDEKQFFNPTPFGEKFDYYPSYGYAFVQHKLEYQDIIINAGLRYDRFSSRVRFVNPFLINTIEYLESTPKSQLSPRLGISHPVAENTILRFNYGHFFEPPLFKHLFTNLDNEIDSRFPLVGDPDLKPQKTIAYELGLDHALSNDLVLGVTAYFKDLRNLTATRRVFHTDGQFSAANGIVTRFINEDYASVKGFDVSLTKRRSRYFSGRLSYSLMVARGNSSDARFAYEEIITGSDSTLPTSPYDLDFDQRHTLVVNADVRTPYDWKGRLFGVIPLSGSWGASAVARYGSGRPFTKENPVTGIRQGGRNEFRMPFTLVLDTRFNRDFRFGDSRFSLSIFFEVENLFNRRNVVNVYPNGLPNADGVTVRDGGVLLSADETQRLNNLIVNDPQNYSAPRQMRLGMQLNF
ncbi:MAG: TonB-dependent receptor, partial [candidate division Zixibacteria bacterium]|nr:TonB-dependent receptor [candidate division Zixibacteria bacterium]